MWRLSLMHCRGVNSSLKHSSAAGQTFRAICLINWTRVWEPFSWWWASWCILTYIIRIIGIVPLDKPKIHQTPHLQSAESKTVDFAKLLIILVNIFKTIPQIKVLCLMSVCLIQLTVYFARLPSSVVCSTSVPIPDYIFSLASSVSIITSQSKCGSI